MRMGIGLISLLVVIAIMLFAFKFYTAPVVQKGKKAQDSARQLAGYDDDGAPATDSITLTEQDKDGKLTGIVVADVKAGGAMEKHFGFRNGDVIVSIGQLRLNENIQSADDAEAFLMEAFQRNYPVVVLRDGNKVTLPSTGEQLAAGADGAPAPQGAPAEEMRTPRKRRPQDQDTSGNSLQRQLDSIQKGQGGGDEQVQ